MSKGLNVKGLCKQMKSEKYCLIWSLKNGVHTITNRKWLIDFEVIPREVKLMLLSIFGEEPEENVCLTKFHYSDEPATSVAVPGAKDIVKNAIPATKTNYLFAHEGIGNLRIFKTAEHFVHVQERYLQAVDDNQGYQNIGSVGPMAPLHFEDINYIVLPVRIPNTEDLLTLKELTNE